MERGDNGTRGKSPQTLRTAVARRVSWSSHHHQVSACPCWPWVGWSPFLLSWILLPRKVKLSSTFLLEGIYMGWPDMTVRCCFTVSSMFPCRFHFCCSSPIFPFCLGDENQIPAGRYKWVMGEGEIRRDDLSLHPPPPPPPESELKYRINYVLEHTSKANKQTKK